MLAEFFFFFSSPKLTKGQLSTKKETTYLRSGRTWLCLNERQWMTINSWMDNGNAVTSSSVGWMCLFSIPKYDISPQLLRCQVNLHLLVETSTVAYSVSVGKKLKSQPKRPVCCSSSLPQTGGVHEEAQFPRVSFRPISSFTGALRVANSSLGGTLWSASPREGRASHTSLRTRWLGNSNWCLFLYLLLLSWPSPAPFTDPQLAACASNCQSEKRQIERKGSADRDVQY